MTSCDLATTFFENRRQERHFDIQFIIFHRSPKFDLFGYLWPQVTFYDLETPFISNLTSRASFWYTIYPLLMRFEFWPEMTPKFLIWPQTRIFLSWNNFEILLIILSYHSRKLIESATRSQKKPKILDFCKNDPIWPQVTLDEIWHHDCCYCVKLHISWCFHD